MTNVLTLILAANLVGLVILMLFAFYFSRLATAPISKLVEIARKIAAGDLDKSFPIGRTDEIGTLSLIFNDLTARLKTQIQQISHQRSKLQDILTNLGVGVVVLDHHKNILHTNPSFFQMLALEDSDIEHKYMLEIIRDEPLIAAIDRTIAQNQRTSGELERLINDQKLFFSYIVTPFWIGEQQAFGAFVQLYDITVHKRLEAIRRDFVANASHELKTPLTSIIGYTETLLAGASKRPLECIRFLRRIREQAQRLEFLVNDLLKLAEIEGEHPLEVKPADLVAVIKEVVDDFKTPTQQKSIQLTVESPETVIAMINEEGIRSVLTNLLDNAIKYTLHNGKIEIRVTENEGDKVRISVIDNGIGIDPKYHNRIFQRFYRVDKTRSRALGGTGLGLAIVKHILERHGSKINVQSELGKGSNFWFELEKA